MPRNGAGAYSLPAGNPVVTGTTISSTVQNTTMADVAVALTQSICIDGQTVPIANLPMSNFKHTGVANGTAATDYAAYGQLTTAVAGLGLQSGQCRLTLSGANLLLSPYNGNRIPINGVLQTIPAAGVTLVPGALTPSTLYYIYAYMVSTTLTLEASTTTHATDTTTGTEIKSGDATRTLVGMAYLDAGPIFVDNVNDGRLVLSYFNRKGKYSYKLQSAPVTSSSPTSVVLTASLTCRFLTWADEEVQCSAEGGVRGSSAGANINTRHTFDGSLSGDLNNAILQPGVTGFDYPTALNLYKTGLSEGFHTTTLLGNVSNSTATTWGSVGAFFNRVTAMG